MTENKALEFVKRRENNLRYFQKHYPDIYRYYANFQLQRVEVVISNAEDEVDLQINGNSLYLGKGKTQGKQGAELFKSTFSEGSYLPSLAPPKPGEYYHPRFAHRQVDAIIRKSPLKNEGFSWYPIPNFYPLVVFQGVGLGYQIQELVETADVENAIIIEPDLEIFAASLLTVDWQKVCSKFEHKDRSIRFLIGVEHTEDALWPALIRHLMHFTPMFPVMNLFLNERGDAVMDAVAKRLNREAITTLSTWGHYDDEIRQLNNAIHAFHLGVKVIPPRGSVSSDIPTLIVGSGPSLDGRIEDIRQVRNKVILISAGTGLRALIENDIYPDFHVELESDYLNYRVISSYNREKLKSVRIIAASQICPLIWDLFGDQRLYFKQENPIGALFGKPEQNIVGGAPTCTNAALALSTQLGLRNVFLFGTDFGFKDHSSHHSKRSVYMESEEESLGKELSEGADKTFSKARTFQVPGVNGTSVHTTPIYFTAKRAVEGLIEVARSQDNSAHFFNCADGAEIEGTTWTSSAAFLEKVENFGSESEQDRVIQLLFNENAETIGLENTDDILEGTRKKLETLAQRIEQEIKGRRLRGKKDITRLCSVVSRYLEGELIKTDPGFYYMIRGAVRHFLYAGFAHAMAMNDEKLIARYLDQWKTSFIDCMNALPEHFSSVTGKTYQLEQDPWVSQSINDPET